MYTEVLAAMAEHLNLPLERVETDHRVFPATEPLSIAAGAIAEGAISHINWRWRGIVAGQTRLTMSIQWYMETAHLPDPHPSLWTIHIEGQPGVRLAVELEKRKGDTSPTSAEQIAVAGSVLNAIPVVTAAAPGLLTRPLATPFRGDLL